MCEYIILNEQRLHPTFQPYWYRYFYQFNPIEIKLYILKMSSPSVQLSHSVISDSLWPCGLQHTRLPCPSPTPGACSDLYPWSQWCHPTISSSVIPFSSCLQSFPASGSFPMSQFFTSGGQIIGASASASVLPMNMGRIDIEYSILSEFNQRETDKHYMISLISWKKIKLINRHEIECWFTRGWGIWLIGRFCRGLQL